jgi:hypothetical protein
VIGTALLGDRLAITLRRHGPLSGSRLSTLVAARKATVLAALAANPMFEHVGQGCDALRFLDRDRLEPGWEPQGTEIRAGWVRRYGGTWAQRLRALEARVPKLEWQRTAS